MPRFRHVDFSFEIKDPWWIKAEIAGYRLSQYDEFWESVIVRGSFRTDLDRAAKRRRWCAVTSVRRGPGHRGGRRGMIST